MRKSMGEMPDALEAKQAMDPEFAKPSGLGGIKRLGLIDSDVYGFVRALRAGVSWEDACESLGANIDRGALEGWRAEIHRRAELPVGQAGVVPAAAVQAAPKAVVAKAKKPRAARRAS
jgi:hypothetical protein